MADKTFRKFRGINDKVLDTALSNHAVVIGRVANAVTGLLRERRLLLVLHVVEVVAISWALWMMGQAGMLPR